MGKSWIDPNNPNQEVWARQYLMKKQAGMTRSNEGVTAAMQWVETESALNFLLRLASNEASEASVVLLKKMELSWKQQKNKHRLKKTQPVNISVQSSNQLKWLARSLRLTKVKTMEAIIAHQVDTQKNIIAQQNDLHERRKQKLEQCELTLNAVEEDKRRLENEINDLRVMDAKLRNQVGEQKKRN